MKWSVKVISITASMWHPDGVLVVSTINTSLPSQSADISAMINHYFPAGTSYHLKKMDGLVVKEYENTLKYALAHCQAKN